MDKTFLNITLITNLLSSLANIYIYGRGYLAIRKSKVDGRIVRVKRNILFQFLVVTISALLFSIVFTIVAFDQDHITLALYILNFALLFLNIGFNLNGVYTAHIVQSYTREEVV